jgi:hypothetical protein
MGERQLVPPVNMLPFFFGVDGLQVAKNGQLLSVTTKTVYMWSNLSEFWSAGIEQVWAIWHGLTDSAEMHALMIENSDTSRRRS